MKDIDKKLKELEEEEKREKEKLRGQVTSSVNLPDALNNEVKPVQAVETPKVVSEVKKPEKPKVDIKHNELFFDEDDVIDSSLNVYNQPREEVKPKVEPVIQKPVKPIVKEEKKVVIPKEEDTNFDFLFDDDEDLPNEKPKINVDSDSIIVNDNIITDDEFFDDFFSE